MIVLPAKGRLQHPRDGSRHKQRYCNKEYPDERHGGTPDQRGEAGGCRQGNAPEGADGLGPAATPEACENNQQAQEPALELGESLDLLTERAGARQLAKGPGERPPGEGYEEQHGASQKTAPDDHAGGGG